MNNLLNEDNLNIVFNIDSEKSETSIVKSEIKEEELITSSSEKTSFDIEETYKNLDKVKKSQFEVIEKSKPLLDASIEISLMSQHPQTIAATASLISSITNASELIAKIETNILKLHQQTTKKETSNVNIDKAVFIGSTAELQKLLNKEKENV